MSDGGTVGTHSRSGFEARFLQRPSHNEYRKPPTGVKQRYRTRLKSCTHSWGERTIGGVDLSISISITTIGVEGNA